jgi:hypothetical protein
MWLEGDQVVLSGGNVATWTNQASNGVSPTACPGAVLSAVSNAANGHAAVHFSLACLTASDDTSFHWGTDDFLVEAVVRVQTNSAAIGTLWNKGAGFYLGAEPGAQIAGYNATGATSDTVTASSAFGADGAFHMVGMRRVGSSFQLRVNGQVMGTTTLGGSEDGNQSGQPLYLGAAAPQYESLTGFVGDVAELVAVHGTTSDTAVANLESYFVGKFALP